MFLARVVSKVTMPVQHPAYDGKKVLIVIPVNENGDQIGEYEIAVDYVGAGEGDLVLAGGAPGVAQGVFGLHLAPIKMLIMAIVDRLNVEVSPDE